MGRRVPVVVLPGAGHGGSGGWYSRGCRCPECCAANTARVARRREERKRAPIPDSVVHGRCSTYTNWSCRCEECKGACSAYMQEQRRAAAGA